MSERKALHMFDLDGTLVDTYALTVQAYRQAGVDFTLEMWGRSAKDWGCTEWQHSKKQEVFAKLLDLWYVPDAWAAKIWRELASNDRMILTGASYPTYSAVLKNRYDLLQADHSSVVARYECSLADKIEYIVQELEHHCVVYYEDQAHIADEIYKRVKADYKGSNFFSVVTPQNYREKLECEL